ncbi:MAG: HIT domain-containing protein [Candidatus Giovannonibacteria bacterium]|nr:MAG: HIT domain-containing protein [Candidatus Giovannonibacteria bacterium]
MSKIEFRKDAVSGEWILISTGIQKKPVFFKRPEERPLPKSKCPFDDAKKSRQEKVLFWAPKPGGKDFRDWWVQIFPNKYPVVARSGICPPLERRGMHEKKIGVGFQEVIVTRSHERHFALMSQEEINLVLEAYQSRFQALASEPCVDYVLIIHNHGFRAGATVPHPHSQIFAIPIIPPDVKRSLEGSRKYFRAHRRCVHCDILKGELKEKERIIYQNKRFIVLAPYASRVIYEARIFPKFHESRFEVIDEAQRRDLSEAMKFIFQKIFKKIKNPDYNFFIHTAPPKERHAEHYHWHMEILPRVAIWGGLELGAGIDVVKVSPEETAKLLRK